METWRNIDSRMFDFAGFYERMAKELPNNCVIAEVGVANGCSAIFLSETLANMGKNFKLYMIDSMDYGHTEQLNEIIKNVMRSGLGGSIEILALDSLNASCKFNDDYFDFVFIDASHEYEPTKADARLWYRKVRDGGTLAGHDYIGHLEVKNAVNEVIPFHITRDPIVHDNGDKDEFESEPFLYFENTKNDCGVWYCIKDFYKKIN